MRILIANTQVPFVYGGAEYLSSHLKENLKRHGHQAEEVRIPFKWYPPIKILEQILAVRLLDLTETCGESIDLVIGLKFPAYFVKHSNKVIWMLHQHKMAYELWGTPFGDLNLIPEGPEVRNAIIKADNEYLTEAKRLFALSKNVAARLKKFNRLNASCLYHPPPNHERLYSDSYENYVFYPSRLTRIKRQHLAIEAMKYVRSNIRLVIAGSAETVEYETDLRRLIEEYGLQERVRLLGEITEDEKIKLYSNALAVLFIPYDEDYGYVTLEAFYSKKAVITCDDSGGPLEFVTHKETGMVCPPLAEPVAEAIEYMANHTSQAAAYGKSGHRVIADLSWDKVIEALTG